MCCLKSQYEWIEETYGFYSDEMYEYLDGPDGHYVCRLPDGHDGPHEFVSTKEIVITKDNNDD